MPQIVGLIESIIKATESDVLRNTAWIIDTYKLSEEDAEKEAKAICAGSQTIAGLRKKMAGKNVAIAYFRDGERLNKNTLDILALAESQKAMKFLDDVTIAVADGNDEIIGEEVPLPEFCSRLGLNFKKTGRYGSSYDASDDASGGGECEDPDDEGDCDSINTPPHIFNRFVGGSKVHYALCHVTRGDDGKEEKLVITTKTEADAKLVSGQQEPVDHFGYYEVDRCGYGSNYVPTIPWRKIGEYVREKKKGEKK